jgi:hypothetical protein
VTTSFARSLYEVVLQTSKYQTYYIASMQLETKLLLEPGNELTVTGYRAKSGSYYLWVTRLKSSNGVQLSTNGKNLIPDKR